MKTTPSKTAKDQRLVYDNQRIDHEGQFWHFDGRADRSTKTLKVYRVRGDINNPAKLNEALQLFAETEALRVAIHLS